jgi:monoterpene epsilon-lactone hydrolase
VRLLVLIGTFICFNSASIATGQEPSENSQAIPIPAAASEELQAAIRDWPRPDSSAMPDVPANDTEWLANIEQSDEQRASGVPLMLEQVPVEVVQDQLAGVKVHRVTPAQVSPANEKRLFLYVHGGAYVYGNGDAGIVEAILIANRIGIPVLSVDYRMPPKHPFPAAVDDVIAVYKDLLNSRSAKSIIIGGTSSGGGLVLAAVHQYRNLNLPIPGAIYAGTPWADLTKTGDTLSTNEGLDRVLVTYDGLLSAAARLYAGKHDMKDPLISPVYGKFDGFPPTILITGTRDLFLSDVARTHRKLRKAGVVADLHVYEGMSHAGYLVSPGTPESLDMYSELGDFIGRYLD